MGLTHFCGLSYKNALVTIFNNFLIDSLFQLATKLSLAYKYL